MTRGTARTVVGKVDGQEGRAVDGQPRRHCLVHDRVIDECVRVIDGNVWIEGDARQQLSKDEVHQGAREVEHDVGQRQRARSAGPQPRDARAHQRESHAIRQAHLDEAEPTKELE